MVAAARVTKFTGNVTIHTFASTWCRQSKLFSKLSNVCSSVSLIAQPKQSKLFPNKSIWRITNQSTIFANKSKLFSNIS